MAKIFGTSTLQERITLAVATGFFCLAVTSAGVNLWQSSKAIRSTLVAQGEAVAERVANRSGTALANNDIASAEGALRVPFSFPDVAKVEIRKADGRLLVSRDKHGSNTAIAMDQAMPTLASKRPRLERETNDSFFFVAPVLSERQDVPVSSPAPNKEPLGYVRITQSKATLIKLTYETLVTNLVLLAAFILAFTPLIGRIARHMAMPLQKLATAMTQVGNGDRFIPIEVDGPKDIREMASAFDNMARVIQERETERETMLDNLRQLAAHVEQVREEQSRSIARELHDSIGGNLTMLKLELASLCEETDPTTATFQRLSALVDLAQRSIRLTKDITAALRPPMLDTMGFVPTVRWYLGEFVRMTHITCNQDLREEFEGAPENRAALFRIVQESLTNVARHANATQVSISTMVANRAFVLTIQDNGRGLSASELEKTGSFGVLGMKERAKHLNGRFEISAAKGGGTEIRVEVPIES